MKNNKTTLKSLKAELELLKASKTNASKTTKDTVSTHKASVAHDIKNSYIQNLHMRSSMFYLWLITGILSYAQKIPFINKIVALLSLYYGRTTFWKLLLKLRKVFVFINATLGVWMVYKTVGFGADNILAGIAGMGHTYIEIITSFSKRMFNWMFELFDYKVVPNVPNNKPSWPEYKPLPKIDLPPIKKDAWIDEMLNKPKVGFEEWLKPSGRYANITINTNPWYTDLSTWLWVAGIAGSLGICYLGYQFMYNPNFIQDSSWLGFLSYFKSNPGGGGIGPDINVSGETIAQASGSQSGGYVGDFFTRSSRSIFRGLNPYSWFKPAADSQVLENTFMLNQASTTAYDNRFYPYTEYNPFAPLHKRLKILIIGESAVDYNARIAIKREILGKMGPDIVMGSALNVPEPSLLNSNWASRTNSPILNELRNLPEIFNSADGIGSSIASGISSGIPALTTDQVFSKLEAIKSSIKASTEVAGTVYKSPSILSEALPNWAEHTVDQTQLDDWHLEHRLHTISYLNSTPVSEATTPLKISNKFSVLTEENI